MQKIMRNFSPEIQADVAAEKLVRVPKPFPVKNCYFVTPDMERLYKKLTGRVMPGICVVCMEYPAIMTCAGPGLKGIPQGIYTFLIWADTHPKEAKKAAIH